MPQSTKRIGAQPSLKRRKILLDCRDIGSLFIKSESFRRIESYNQTRKFYLYELFIAKSCTFYQRYILSYGQNHANI